MRIAWMALVAVVCLGNAAWAANSGGENVDLYYTNSSNVSFNGYIGSYQPGGSDATGGNVNIDSNVGTSTNHRSVLGGFSQGGSVMHNRVFMSGGTVYGEVFRGFSNSGNANAIHNSVTSMGSPTFNTHATNGTALVGGFTDPGSGDRRTGNTLNILTSGITVQQIINFQYYNFSLFGGTGAGLTLTGTEDIDVAKFEAGDVVNVTHALGGHKLNVNDTVTLLSTTTAMTGLTTAMLPAGQVDQGLSLAYDYTLASTDKTITATINSVGVSQKSATLFEGQTAGMTTLNTGMDFLASAGIAQARDVAGLNNTTDAYASFTGDPRSVRPGVFAAVSGGRMRYKTNGHTDVNGISLVTGLSVGFKNLGRGQAVIGAFFELGYGDFDCKSDVGLTSDGYNRALGGGLLARYEANNGFYAEASARLGSIKNSYANDFTDLFGNSVSYHTTSTYYGAHAGLGYIFNPVEKVSLDLSTKYFWAHQNGSDVLVLNDPFSFAAMNSQRWVTGARVSYEVTPCVAPYAGASFEYEFDGTARGTTYGLAMREASLRGATGGAELGVVIRPRRDKTMFIDVGAQGYFGKRQGVTGTARFGLEF